MHGNHGLFVPMATAPYEQDESSPPPPPASCGPCSPCSWRLDRTGLLTAPPDAVEKVADRLDHIAERCGPAIATYSNLCQTLAVELADAPADLDRGRVRAGPGRPPLAAALAEPPATPLLVAELPEALASHSACSPAVSWRARTPTTSSGTAASRHRCTRAWSCCATGRSAAFTAAPSARDLALSHAHTDQRAGAGTGELETLAELIAITISPPFTWRSPGGLICPWAP